MKATLTADFVEKPGADIPALNTLATEKMLNKNSQTQTAGVSG
ncbi:MAG: hypothetical protein ACYTBV_18675 [Planctomycetota bacterium]|jgi:hypothetical protein